MSYIGLFTRVGEVGAAEYHRVRVTGSRATFPTTRTVWGVIRSYGVFDDPTTPEPTERIEIAPMMVLEGETVTLDIDAGRLTHETAGVTQHVTLSAQPQRTNLRG